MFCCLIAAFQKLVNVSKYLDVLNNILLNGKPEIQDTQMRDFSNIDYFDYLYLESPQNSLDIPFSIYC